MFDYRVMVRFGLDWKRLPSSAVIINQPESFYHLHKDLIRNVILVFCLLLLAFLGATYWWVQSRLVERKLRVSEENLRTTLDSISDAVITPDTKGCVVRMNPVARQLTGWKVEDVTGRALADIFNIVNSRIQEPAANPVTQVLQCGEVVGLATTPSSSAGTAAGRRQCRI